MEKVWGSGVNRRFLLEPGDNRQIIDFLHNKWIAVRYPLRGLDTVLRSHNNNSERTIPWVVLTMWGENIHLMAYNWLLYEKEDERLVYGELLPDLSGKIEDIQGFLTRARIFGAHFYFMEPYDLWSK